MAEPRTLTDADAWDEALASPFDIRFYVIERVDGTTYYTYATGVRVEENGSLAFFINQKKDLQYAAGRWVAWQEVSEEEYDRA